MNLESIKKYVLAVFLGLIVFFGLLFYLFLRRGYYDLYIVNKVFAGTSLIVLATVLLIGSLGRLYNFFDPWLVYRKHLGIISFVLAFLHSITSLFFLPNKFTFNYFLTNYLTFGLGLIALIILGYLFFISFDRFIGNMDKKNGGYINSGDQELPGFLCFFIWF